MRCSNVTTDILSNFDKLMADWRQSFERIYVYNNSRCYNIARSKSRMKLFAYQQSDYRRACGRTRSWLSITTTPIVFRPRGKAISLICEKRMCSRPHLYRNCKEQGIIRIALSAKASFWIFTFRGNDAREISWRIISTNRSPFIQLQLRQSCERHARQVLCQSVK